VWRGRNAIVLPFGEARRQLGEEGGARRVADGGRVLRLQRRRRRSVAADGGRVVPLPVLARVEGGAARHIPGERLAVTHSRRGRGAV